jgi:hypothetical protein
VEANFPAFLARPIDGQQQGRLTVDQHFAVSEVARRYSVPPRVISDLFYARRLDDRVCPIVSGRRLIPRHYLPQLEAVLRDAGHLPPHGEAVFVADVNVAKGGSACA